jgi:hypothetical protein
MKYSLDEIFTYEIQEAVQKQFLLMHYDIAEEEEVRDAIEVLLRYLAFPGEDYDGLLEPD